MPIKKKVALSVISLLAALLASGAEDVAPARPNVEALRSLEMDAASVYDDYEELWSRAVAVSSEELHRWQSLVDAMAERTPDDVWAECGFRVWTVKGEDPWREESYLPWREPKWELHSVDGANPSERERKTYRKQKRKEAKQEEKLRRRASRKGEPYSPPSHPVGAGPLAHSFVPNVAIRGGGSYFLGMSPDPNAEEPGFRGTQGTVGLNEAGQIESIDQRSFEPFKGGGGVTIEKFQLRSLFRYDESLQLPVLQFQEHAMAAKVLRFVNARGRTTRWYADVRCDDQGA